MDRRILIVISKIESEFSLAWSTEELARLVTLSPSHLRRLFKTQTGNTPAQYLKSRRMQAAAALLSAGFLGVKEVMKLVGINNHSHFESDFKERYGIPPAKYRNSVRALSSRDSKSS
jgi:transcriptional regulator GlxA family with amidase domain